MKSLLLACAAVAASAQTTRPLIGILTLPNDLGGPFTGYRSYFPASYVKFVEAGGARAVPIPYTSTQAELQQLLPYLNGFLFTGGGAAFSENGSPTPFAMTANAIYQEVLSAAQKGESVPLHGTCLGHELIHFLVAGLDQSVVSTGFNAENYSIPLNLTDAAATSRLYGPNAPQDVVQSLSTLPITMNAHQAGITPQTFAGNQKLSSTLRVLSTNVDRNGRAFISTTEGITLPITTTQYHSEKIAFEWNPAQAMNHSYVSVVANAWISRYFVNEARANARAFPSQEAEWDALIYQYRPYFAANTTEFDLVYVFE